MKLRTGPGPEVPPSQRPTVIKNAVFVPEPRRWPRLRALLGEALDLPPGQAIAALAAGGAVGLLLLIIIGVCVAEAM